MISNSLMGREKREISSRDLILPSFTNLPSLVTGIHSFSSLPPRPPRPRPRPRPRSPPRPRPPNPPRKPPRSAGAASAIFLICYFHKPKHPQTQTPTNPNTHKPKHPRTPTPTNPNTHTPQHPRTETPTNPQHGRLLRPGAD